MQWLRGQSLDAALARLVEAWRLINVKGEIPLPFVLTNNPQHVPKLRDEHVNESWPDELTSLFRVVTGQAPHENDGDPSSVRLRCVEDVQWVDRSELAMGEMDKTHPAWFAAQYIAFGDGIFGDTIAWCADAPERPRGMIVLLDHEGGGPENDPGQPQGIIVLGDSLADWLSRWAAFEFEEYAYLSGELKNLPRATQKAFLQDHARLNPGLTWAKERLEAIK